MVQEKSKKGKKLNKLGKLKKVKTAPVVEEKVAAPEPEVKKKKLGKLLKKKKIAAAPVAVEAQNDDTPAPAPVKQKTPRRKRGDRPLMGGKHGYNIILRLPADMKQPLHDLIKVKKKMAINEFIYQWLLRELAKSA